MNKLKSHSCFAGTTEFWEHNSQTTNSIMKFSLYRPQAEVKGGLIWLSGLTCTEENFIMKAGAQRVLSDLGLALICPDTSPRGLNLPQEHDSYDFGTGAGFFVDATTPGYKDHYRMESYINEELFELFNTEFNLQGNISLFGHSMGGHGALTIGLKNPGKYKSISALSPIVNPMACSLGQKAFKGYLGADQEVWKPYDACQLIATGHKHPNPILIEQGLADEFYKDQLLTNNFVEVCKANGQPLKAEFRENFDHSYYFVSTFIEDHIRHHLTYL